MEVAANVVPAHKEEDKAFIVNYRPISLLPIFGKISDRLMYNSLLYYFLRTPSLSSFLPGDSWIAQLLSILHQIQNAFDENRNRDVRSVFLDISKTFDKVWHDGLIFKLKVYGIEGEILSLLEKYLQNREQRVVLNGETSESRKINSRVLSVLESLFFWFAKMICQT